MREALRGEAAGEMVGGLGGSGDETVPQGEILDGVSRDDHLGEHDEMGSSVTRLASVSDDAVAITFQIPDNRVDLGQSYTKLYHGGDSSE
ncbi:hypothetical protein GCM10026982_50470 [Nocardiopsis aegyptia]